MPRFLPDKRADRNAEARPDWDVVGNPGAFEQTDDDLPVRVARVDADERKGCNLRHGYLGPACKGMRLGDDTEQPPARQRLEIDRRVFEAVADRHHLAASEQQIVDRILDLQDVEVDLEVDIFASDDRDGARHHEVADARRRADLKFRAFAPRERVDRDFEVVDVAMDFVDLSEDSSRLGRRDEPAAEADEKLHPKRVFGVLHEPAQSRRGDVEMSRRSGQCPRHHHGPNNFDLAQR